MDIEKLADHIWNHYDHVFFDVDGVLANWAGSVAQLFGQHASSVSPSGRTIAKELGVSNNKIWRTVEAAGRAFWVNLQPIPEGMALWSAIQRRKMPQFVLTSPSHDPESAAGKMWWFQQHLRLNPSKHDDRFIITRLKYLVARNAGSLLIDDAERNVLEFREAGGSAMLWPVDAERLSSGH